MKRETAKKMVLTRRAVAARQAAGLWSAEVPGGAAEAAATTRSEFDSFPTTMRRQNISHMMTRTKAAKKRRPSPPSSARNAASGAIASASPAATGSGAAGSGRPNDGPAPPRRRPTRPVDRRLKMLDWLVDKLDREEMPENLRWLEKGRVFTVKWPHAASQRFSSTVDARLFKAWAEHSGLHVEGDTPDHKKWKANFRCAIHSLHTVREIPVKDGRKGSEAARIYHILEKPEPKKARSRISRPQVLEDEIKGEDSDSGVSTAMDNPERDSLPLPVTSILRMEAPTDSSLVEDSSGNIPDFESLGLPCIQPNLLSGGCMITKEEPPVCSSSDAIISVPSRFFCLPEIPRISTSFPLASYSSSSPPSTSSSSSSSSPSLSLSSIPIPTTTTLPQELVDDMMRPVGIMTVTTTRDRTPSGDSGVPGSPPLDLWEGSLERVVLDVHGHVIEEISVDEGIDLMYEIEVHCSEPGQPADPSSWPTSGGVFLDISRNAPVPAVAMEVTMGEEDFKYTCLDLQDSTMELV